MPPIREMFFTVIAIMLFAFGGILFVGGYEQANGLPSANIIATNYNAITSNSAIPGGLFGNLSGLSKAVNTSASGVNNTGSSSTSIIINSVSLIVGFMTSLPTIYGAFVNFIAIPIQAIGVPTGFAQILANILILGMAALAIISALFLFPI